VRVLVLQLVVPVLLAVRVALKTITLSRAILKKSSPFSA
jgi:hypothetical protein